MIHDYVHVTNFLLLLIIIGDVTVGRPAVGVLNNKSELVK